eukprot:SAG31_NODE_1273_length_9057_cov_13.364103_6_plen_449_part_00
MMSFWAKSGVGIKAAGAKSPLGSRAPGADSTSEHGAASDASIIAASARRAFHPTYNTFTGKCEWPHRHAGEDCKPAAAAPTAYTTKSLLHAMHGDVAKERRHRAAVTSRTSKKFLFFDTDTRPPFYGQKGLTSTKVTGRRPLALDSQLEYDYDSEEDWVEPEDGEDLAHSDGEDEEEEAEDEEGGFVVPDGTFYDDEGIDADATDRLQTKGGFKIMDITVITDPEKLDSVAMVQFGTLMVTTAPSRYDTDENGRNLHKELERAAERQAKQEKKDAEKRKKELQPEMLPDLVRLVHAQAKAVPKIIEEFTALYDTVSKSKVKAKLEEIAEKRGKVWVVTDAGMLEACGLARTPIESAMSTASPSPSRPVLTDEEKAARAAERRQREEKMDALRRERFRAMDKQRAEAEARKKAEEEAERAEKERVAKEKSEKAAKESEKKKMLDLEKAA